MFAVTGASGQLGRLVIERLLERVPAGQVVAAMRDAAKGADLSRLGVLVREADYKRPATLSKAFEGVDRILLISSTEVVGRLPLHRAVIDAAQAQGVSLFAYTSMLHADTSPARLAIEHRQTEAAIKLRLPRSRGRFVDLGATRRLLLFACLLRRPWANGIPGRNAA